MAICVGLFCPPIILIVETLKPWDKKIVSLISLNFQAFFCLRTYTDQILNEPWSDLDKSDAGLIHRLDLVYELQQDYNFGGNTVGDLSLSTM